MNMTFTKEVQEKLKRIEELKEEKNAVILAHYYVDYEVQKCADYIGDSYYLSDVATKVSKDKIVFAGVEFMGESAKLLNPSKRVFMPDINADCPMAHMATEEEIKNIREEYDDVAVVCYINSTATLKALSDVCVTSANAVKIVKNLPNKNIFFIPDANLGNFVREKVPEKNIITNNGHCPRHTIITPEKMKEVKEKYPNALVAVHPECLDEVVKMADFVGSTTAIIKYVTESNEKEFIIGTVDGVFPDILEKTPDKVLHTVIDNQVCVNMKKVTLDNIINVLETEQNEVFVSDDLMKNALIPLERMLELAK